MIVSHLGNGIMQFNNVFSIDKEHFESFKKSLENTTRRENKIIDDDGSVHTEGAYKIPIEHIKYSPTRYTDLSSFNGKDKELISTLQQAMHRCVVEYCKVFPVVIENIRWVTNGYIIKYENGQSIGPHSDCNIAYAEDNVTPINTIPIYNILTVGAFLNEDFVGGDISYRPWGITTKPKTGSVLVYPSSYMGCHEVSPVTEGERYAYLRWYGHGEPPHANNESVMHLLESFKTRNTEQKLVLTGKLYETE
jgi:predicted 2-oxoglutarate/Fe(II)-dependent dioxygenase YbiX